VKKEQNYNVLKVYLQQKRNVLGKMIIVEKNLKNLIMNVYLFVMLLKDGCLMEKLLVYNLLKLFMVSLIHLCLNVNLLKDLDS
jgi:hypothetical protein